MIIDISVECFFSIYVRSLLCLNFTLIWIDSQTETEKYSSLQKCCNLSVEMLLFYGAWAPIFA